MLVLGQVVATQAAGGWRSCAADGPIGRCVASASVALSSEEEREEKTERWPFCRLVSTCAYTLAGGLFYWTVVGRSMWGAPLLNCVFHLFDPKGVV